MMDEVVYTPIGVIHSPFKEPKGVPIQPGDRKGVRGMIEVKPRYAKGLKDLEGFSHLIVLFHMHLTKGYELEVVPFLDSVKRGLFSTRAPRRPNPIGLSVLRLQSIQGTTLHVCDLDIVDGTPLLDIKPYVPKFEKSEDVKIGWLTGRSQLAAEGRADERFSR